MSFKYFRSQDKKEEVKPPQQIGFKIPKKKIINLNIKIATFNKKAPRFPEALFV
jgi:hypothetical protein